MEIEQLSSGVFLRGILSRRNKKQQLQHNICRSAAAKVVFEEMAHRTGVFELFSVDSAATSTEELGNDIYPPMKRALSARGYACAPHRARQATQADCERADHILCADRANVRNMKRIAGQAAGGRR